MNNLTQKKCEACSIDTPPMKREAIMENLGKLHKDWSVVDERQISRDFTFKNFREAIDFVNQVAELAEEEGHHPDIYVHNFRNVLIDLMTQKIQGLSLNDFIMAAKIDELR
ncbi:4a-hydroxytetrahydrobiopterin dehydratase [Candidatus Roizmanbacteria bacterium]|nr:MAG: 4a-hydroxytetrahydrobiopterin dehydratase [Candidatus Roizmanbacteria bacterium]